MIALALAAAIASAPVNVRDERVDALTNRAKPFVVWVVSPPDCPEAANGIKTFAFQGKVNGKVVVAACPDGPVQLLAGTPADELAMLLSIPVESKGRTSECFLTGKQRMEFKPPATCIDYEVVLQIYKEDQ